MESSDTKLFTNKEIECSSHVIADIIAAPDVVCDRIYIGNSRVSVENSKFKVEHRDPAHIPQVLVTTWFESTSD